MCVCGWVFGGNGRGGSVGMGRGCGRVVAALPPVPDGVEDEKDEEAALEGGHEPQEGPGGGEEEAGGAGDEYAHLVHPVAGVGVVV